MSGQTQRDRPRFSFHGLRAGEMPYVRIVYHDRRGIVQRALDGSPEAETLLAAAIAEAEAA